MINTNYLAVQINKAMKLDSVNKYQNILSELETLDKRLSDETFKIAVVGEFSSGKSTFINAIIGKDILKHAATETTAAITYICNVPQDDKRAGTCEIVFTDNKHLKLDDMTLLREYTTVNNERDVAETIRSVTVYVNFLDVSYPIIIADTPGLNGIADKHREITLDEIRKAHACIYLLSVNGIKESDSEFIKILLNYQNRFIFVQNFTDLLRESEGETVEMKLKTDETSLARCFEGSIGVKYRIFGISAVKALAAKDTEIKKVFINDTEEITDRKSLYKISNFIELENELTQIVNSGEYMEMMRSSSAQTLVRILEELLNGLENERQINEELRTHDDRNKRIERAGRMISRLDEQIPVKRKNIENFMDARDSDNRKSLKDEAKRLLDELYKQICEKIDNRIRVFEDIDSLEITEGKPMPKYYADMTADDINGNIVPNLDTQIINDLNHLYDEAILKVTNFTHDMRNSDDRVTLIIDNSRTKFNANAISGKEGIEQDSRKVEMLKRSMQKTSDDLERSRQEKNRTDSALNAVQSEKRMEQDKINADRRSLGNMPVAESRQIQVEKTRTVERHGLFKGLRNFLFGEKTETYYVYETQYDYTRQNEWKNKKQELDRRESQLNSRYESRIDNAIAKKNELEREILKNERESDRYRREIADLEARIKREREIYENALKANKREYCENEKRRLKCDIEKALFDSAGTVSCTLERLVRHIDSISSSNLPSIKKKVLDYFNSSVENMRQNLQQHISASEEELNKQYDVSSKDISEINEIIKEIRKGYLYE